MIEADIYIGRLTMPMGSGDRGDRVLSFFLFGHISHGWRHIGSQSEAMAIFTPNRSMGHRAISAKMQVFHCKWSYDATKIFSER